MTVGVLAFQGDVIEHLRALTMLGAEACEVRSVDEFQKVDALIIPGGESTVISEFLELTGLRDVIIDRCRQKSFPIFGTCAGAIVMGKPIVRHPVGALHATPLQPLGLMDITVERNAYGRQTDSFEAEIAVDFPEGRESVHGLFIRAPKIVSVGEGVTVLARCAGLPVLCQQGSLLAATFHPELMDRPSTPHRHFLSLIGGKVDKAC
jgi:pyridoxal 5'-phosphate synthase pdxT subunit